MPDKHYIGLDLTGFENKGRARPVSRVTLFLDDENVLTAGDDTGLELTAECPHATQAMADAVLARLKGYTYQMYGAAAANLDPAAELGDGITAGGVYSVISRISDGGDGYPDLEAPGEAEPEDEFPSQGPMTRAFNRKIADARASITKTADSIKLEVSRTYATKDALSATETRLSSSITQTAESITSQVSATYATKDALGTIQTTLSSAIEQTATTIREEVKNTADGLQASITVNANAIEQRVSRNGVISAINQSAEQIAIQAGRISLQGAVSVNGTFKINEQGYLECTGGTIGGYTIDSTRLYSGGTGISNNIAQYVFWAGETNGQLGSALTDAPFRVGGDGGFIASNAYISGTVNATSGTFQSVTISGSTFSGSLNQATGTLNGVTGSYGGSINSGGTFRGTATGTLTGIASSAMLSSCSLGGTSLITGSGTGSFSALNGAGTAVVRGSTAAALRCGNSSVIATASQVAVNGGLQVYGGLATSGDKNRMIKTPHFGTRCLAAFETPLPTFSDYGTAALDESGVCFICIDPIFAETVNGDYRPAVFLTPYGDGALWVEKAERDAITVKGTPGLRFSWEARYAQTNAYAQRLKALDFDAPDTSGEHDFDSEAAVQLEHTAPDLALSALNELTSCEAAAVDYGQAGYEYYTEFGRRLTA